ncbi:MAG TPA: hypothetical protein VN982_09700 [Candidatus Dormibacteraeota bacterium]|nr:hypothetical protein [Candidatus Dormibacteraeota bacterium]
MLRILARSLIPCLILLAPMLGRAQTPEPQKTHPEDSVSPGSITRSPLEKSPYEPITGKQRVEWFFIHTVGPKSLMLGTVTAAFGTAQNKPVEYGPHWEGFGKRYGMRFTGVATGNAVEASLGSLWGEDPRYFRTSGQRVPRRIGNVIVKTFLARRRDGHFAPAYARFVGIPGNNFLANTWRADSEANVSSALIRTLIGFAGRMADNAWQEFSPSLLHRRRR